MTRRFSRPRLMATIAQATTGLPDRLVEDIALRLMASWGGHALPELGSLHVKRLERDRRIRDALSAEVAPEEVAAREGLSVRQVLRIDQSRPGCLAERAISGHDNPPVVSR